jgi:hypothetical protein
VRHLVVVIAWVIYLRWWFLVLRGVAIAEFATILGWIALAALLILVVGVLWIRHNLSVAAHGSRGGSTRFLPQASLLGQFEGSTEFPLPAGCSSARRVTIEATAGRRRFVLKPDVRVAL